ncbi:MAG: 4-alpha-glucanotransferase [Clostridia bacterium]|nr:4-alpha-glucanotransferase [Clostridia bacterium]NCC42612.1 4-alpha-glucanotransferase [Clostridia bacterium]
MSDQRQAGILMPVASLPSLYGVGDFGKEAYAFADCISKMGFGVWQILPLNPLGYGNSPYQPYSSYAGDPLYLSLEKLTEDGLLDEVPAPYQADSTQIDYEAVREYKDTYLRIAFKNFEPDESYEEFAYQEWVYHYGVFHMLKWKNDRKCWLDWQEQDKYWMSDKNREFTVEQEQEIQYQMFLQYMFYCQWMELKSYVNELGIKIMGDLPFYVGIDSLDVWANTKCFLLDENFRPTYIAGVPPDYFSPTGQRWGNPIYDWEYLKSTDYEFWMDRIGYNQNLFDIVRIDHFRAFDTYWKIPSSCPTAIDGEWVEAPGYDVFEHLLKKYPDIEIVIEDLGDLRPQVKVLRDHFNFKGMKVYQFSLDPDEKNNDFPDRENMILYTGTHDNQTIKGWYLSKAKETQDEVQAIFAEKGCQEEKLGHRFIHAVLESIAALSVVSVQDILDMADEARINRPGTTGSPNWEWKIKDLSGIEKEIPAIQKLIQDAGR